MRVKSINFNHLDEIPTMFTEKGDGLSPSIYWYNYPQDYNVFLLTMTNMNTNKLHWALITNKTELKINEKTGNELPNHFNNIYYVPPNDIDDISTYRIDVYAIKNTNLTYLEMISDNNVIDKGFIKFIYNGY